MQTAQTSNQAKQTRSHTLRELRAAANAQNIDGWAKMTKAELQQALGGLR